MRAAHNRSHLSVLDVKASDYNSIFQGQDMESALWLASSKPDDSANTTYSDLDWSTFQWAVPQICIEIVQPEGNGVSMNTGF